MRIIEIIDGPNSIEGQLQRIAISDDRLKSHIGKRLQELVLALRKRGTAPVVGGSFIFPELSLHSITPQSGTQMNIWVDWFDGGQVVDRLPTKLHYRLDIHRKGTALSVNIRADTLAEAVLAIERAFEWTA